MDYSPKGNVHLRCGYPGECDGTNVSEYINNNFISIKTMIFIVFFDIINLSRLSSLRNFDMDCIYL